MVNIAENETWADIRRKINSLPDSFEVATFAALASVTDSDVAVGDEAIVGNLGRYTRAADDATDADLDYSGGSGVKWYVPSAGGFASLYVFGAEGDGTTDDHAVLALAEASSKDILVDDGTFLIGSSITLTSKLKFRGGGQLKHASGVTITANGLIYADMSGAIHTGEGSFVPGLAALTVGSSADYATAMECIADIPRVLWQSVDVQFTSGETFAEDLILSGYVSASTTTANEANRIRLMASDAGGVGNATIGSLYANGGTLNILVQNINPTRPTPYDNETAAMAFYDVGANVADCDLSGAVGASKGIVVYGRGRATATDLVFGTDVFEDAMTVKNGASLSSKGGHTGHVTGSAFRTQNGTISVRDTEGLTSDGELFRSSRLTDQGMIINADSRTIEGPTSFAIPYYSKLETKFLSLDGFTTAVTGGGIIEANLNRGLRVRSSGGGSGTSNLNYEAIEMIGDDTWDTGVKSMVFAGCAITPVSGAALRVVLGDYSTDGVYIGFLIENLTPKAVYSTGGAETVAHTYSDLTEDETFRFGLRFDGNQIAFLGEGAIAPVATVTTGLPTGALPDKKIEIDLNTTANCVYSIRELNALWSPDGI